MRASGRPGVRTCERPDVRASERPSVQASERPSVRTSLRPGIRKEISTSRDKYFEPPLNPLTSHKNRPELPGSYAAFVFVDPSYKNQEKDIDIRTRHWHWHWLCFSAFFLPWGVSPPSVEQMRKTKPMPMPVPNQNYDYI